MARNLSEIMTNDRLIKVCSDFYSDTEIESAKSLAHDACGICGIPPRRNGPERKQNNLKDILLYLDEAEVVPRFVAYDIMRLRPISINHLDSTVLVQEMNCLKTQISSLCETVAELMHGQAAMKCELIRLREGHTPITDVGDAAADTVIEAVVTRNVTEEHSSISATLTPSSSDVANYSRTVTEGAQISPPSLMPQPAVVARPMPPLQPPPPARSARGDGQQGLRGVVPMRRRADFFISRLGPEATVEAVTAHLKAQLGTNDIECEKLETRYDTYASFKVSVDNSKYRRMREAGVWPDYVLCRRYFAPRG